MVDFRKRALAAMVAAGAMALGGCTYDDYGYGGVSVGYGAPGGYYDDYVGGYGYGGAGYGWFGDYYYPGSGYYVFDRGGRRHRWNDDQRRHWEGRRQAGRDDRGPGRGDGWRGADRGGDRRAWRGGAAPAGAATAQPGDRRGWRGRAGPDGIATPPAAGREAYRAQRQAARDSVRAQRGGGVIERAPRSDGGGRGFRSGGGDRGGGNRPR